MEKAIFSISCTTCHARLAVRSEAAIGAILECPRCQSMVLVTPPPGWTPAPPPVAPSAAAEAATAGPPPLDRVATAPLKLELELAETPFLVGLLRRKWFAWSAGALAATGAIVLTLWLMTPRSESTVDAPEATTETIAASAAAPVVEQPTESKTATSETPAEPKTAATETKPSATTSQPSPSTVPPSTPADAKPKPAESLASTDAAVTNGRPTELAPPMEIKKAPPTPVDVAARLNDPIARLETADMPLVQAVDLLASIGALPITIDADAVRLLGRSLRTPITLQLGPTTVGEALQAVVVPQGLAVAVENSQVLVTAPADYRDALRTIRYTVTDLTGNDPAAAAELAAMVRTFVSPDSWHGNSGRGTIDAKPDALVVTQTGDVHRQVLVFCEKLRNARGKPLRSRNDPAEFTLATRTAQAYKMLEQPVTANFHRPTPLVDVLAFLARAAHGDILIDRAALADAETSDRVEATLAANGTALADALRELLHPLGLSYRIIGPNVLQVTTNEAAEERLDVEFYPVGLNLKRISADPQANKGADAKVATLIESLKTRVSPSTWAEAGGSGEIGFDPPSQCLIVLQSQAVQAAVERMLLNSDKRPNPSQRGSP